MARRRAAWWLAGVGVPAAVIVLVAIFWSWDWFIPMVQTRAAAALGRQVTISHLQISPGRVTEVADDITIANPPGWGDAPPRAHVDGVKLSLDIWTYIRHRRLVLPLVGIDKPVVNALSRPDGKENYKLELKPSSGGSNATKIGDLRIYDGKVMQSSPS